MCDRDENQQGCISFRDFLYSDETFLKIFSKIVTQLLSKRYKIKYWTQAVAPSNLYTLIVSINKSRNQATKIVENGPKGDFQEIGNRFLGVLPNI